MTVEAFRQVHAANPFHCTPDCLGWVPDVSGEIQRCDECWSAVPADYRPSDDLAALVAITPV
jgi:hypothetical protein